MIMIQTNGGIIKVEVTKFKFCIKTNNLGKITYKQSKVQGKSIGVYRNFPSNDAF